MSKNKPPPPGSVEVDPLLFVIIFGALAFWAIVLALIAGVYAVCVAVWMFMTTYPLVSVLIVVAVTILLLVMWTVHTSKPELLPGHFKVIPLCDRDRREYRVAKVNDAWWLILPGAWIIATAMGFVLSAISGLIGLADVLFSDALAGALQFDPALSAIVSSHPWLGYMFLVLVFFSAAIGAMRQTIWLAWVRSSAVRKDPRRIQLLKLIRTINWWNEHLPVFNDLAASGEGKEQVEKLAQTRAKLVEWLNRMCSRLAVAPLGSFPQSATPLEIPELRELGALVEDLKHQPILQAIKADLEDLEHPDRTPDPKTVERWHAFARFLRLKVNR